MVNQLHQVQPETRSGGAGQGGGGVLFAHTLFPNPPLCRRGRGAVHRVFLGGSFHRGWLKEAHLASKSKLKSVACCSEQLLGPKFSAGVWAVAWEMTISRRFLSFVPLCGR